MQCVTKKDTYMKEFEESMYMTLLVTDDDLVNESNQMGNRITSMSGKKFESNQVYNK